VPSSRHEALVEPIRQEPTLLQVLLRRALGDTASVEVLESFDLVHARIVDPTVPQLVSPSRLCELAIEVPLRDRGGRAVMLIEVQLRRERAKELSWPLYWAAAYARYAGGPTWLVVITTRHATERWANDVLARSIPAVGRWLVLGPSNVPRIASAHDARRDPAAAIFSALVHAGSERDVELVEAMATACSTLPSERGKVFFDILQRWLSSAARVELEAMMLKHGPVSDWARQHLAEGLKRGREEGREQGRIEAAQRALLAVIEGRGLALTQALRKQVRTCRDVAVLERWLKRAAVADTNAQIFASPVRGARSRSGRATAAGRSRPGSRRRRARRAGRRGDARPSARLRPAAGRAARPRRA
jgi:hypothetical protein